MDFRLKRFGKTEGPTVFGQKTAPFSRLRASKRSDDTPAALFSTKKTSDTGSTNNTESLNYAVLLAASKSQLMMTASETLKTARDLASEFQKVAQGTERASLLSAEYSRIQEQYNSLLGTLAVGANPELAIVAEDLTSLSGQSFTAAASLTAENARLDTATDDSSDMVVALGTTLTLTSELKQSSADATNSIIAADFTNLFASDQAQIDSLNTESSNVSGAIVSLEGESGASQTALNDAVASRGALEAQVTAAQDQLVLNSSSITSLGYVVEIAAEQAQLTALSDSSQTLAAEIVALSSQSNDLVTSLSQPTDVREDMDASSAQMNVYDGDLDLVDAGILDTSGVLSGHEADSATNATSITSLQGEIDALDTQIASEQAQLTTLGASSTDLTSDIDSLSSDKADLETQLAGPTDVRAAMDASSAQMAADQGSLSTVSGQLSAANTTLTVYQASSTDIESQLEIASSGVANIEASIAAEQAQIDTLNTSSAGIVTDLGSLDTESAALDTQLSSPTDVRAAMDASSTAMVSEQANLTTLDGQLVIENADLAALQGTSATNSLSMSSLSTAITGLNNSIASQQAAITALSGTSSVLTSIRSNLSLASANLTSKYLTTWSFEGGETVWITSETSSWTSDEFGNSWEEFFSTSWQSVSTSYITSTSVLYSSAWISSDLASMSSLNLSLVANSTSITNVNSSIDSRETNIANYEAASQASATELADRQTSQTTIDGNIATEQAGIDTLNASSVTAQANYNTLSSDYTSLSLVDSGSSSEIAASIDAVDTQIAGKNADLATVDTGLTAHSSSLAYYEALQADPSAEISRLSDDRTTVEGQIVAQQAVIGGLTSDSTNLENDLAVVSPAYLSLSLRDSGSSSVLQVQINDLNLDLADKNTTLAAVTSDIAAHQTALTGYEGASAVSDAALGTVQTNQTAVEGLIAAAQAAITALNVSSTDLQNSYDAVSQSYISLSARDSFSSSAIQDQIDDVSGSLDLRNADLGTVDADIGTHNANLTNYQDLSTTNAPSIAALEGSNTNLSNDIAADQTEIGNLNVLSADLSNSVGSLYAQITLEQASLADVNVSLNDWSATLSNHQSESDSLLAVANAMSTSVSDIRANRLAEFQQLESASLVIIDANASITALTGSLGGLDARIAQTSTIMAGLDATAEIIVIDEEWAKKGIGTINARLRDAARAVSALSDISEQAYNVQAYERAAQAEMASASSESSASSIELDTLLAPSEPVTRRVISNYLNPAGGAGGIDLAAAEPEAIKRDLIRGLLAPDSDGKSEKSSSQRPVTRTSLHKKV